VGDLMARDEPRFPIVDGARPVANAAEKAAAGVLARGAA
jgi:hypothetical protein